MVSGPHNNREVSMKKVAKVKAAKKVVKKASKSKAAPAKKTKAAKKVAKKPLTVEQLRKLYPQLAAPTGNLKPVKKAAKPAKKIAKKVTKKVAKKSVKTAKKPVKKPVKKVVKKAVKAKPVKKAIKKQEVVLQNNPYASLLQVRLDNKSAAERDLGNTELAELFQSIADGYKK